ncbi:MAG: CotH kinase family protein [Chryseotalea sp.]|jgi:hypothetical protein
MKKFLPIFFMMFALVTQAQIVINEISSSNGDQIYDPDNFNFVSWIELYNAGSSSVNVNGYALSDNSGQPLKWRIPVSVSIPAKGYLLIWCDGANFDLHTNFELNSGGEEIILSNSSGIQIDKVTYPALPTNITFGRMPDGTSAIGMLTKFTPGNTNQGSIATSQTNEPTFSLESGRYTGTQSISLLHTDASAQIRYTINGSEPTELSTLYTSPLSINAFTTIKAKAFATSKLPSKTVVKTYLVNNRTSTLPVIAITANPDYLYDNTIGIIVRGNNGITGYCQGEPANWNRDWDRHADFEYFDTNGVLQVSQSVEIRVGGNCSRTQAQKSLVVKARNKFGSNIINYKFFDNKDVHKVGGLMLRNSGNDFNVSMFRDAFMQYMPVEYMDVDYMDYKPAVLYVNGQYMGIINIREKIDADFIESNYGIQANDLDLLETYTNALEGTSDAYANYLNSLRNINRTTPEAFQLIDQNIDVQEYINYLVTQIFIANLDWPGNNMKFWRQRSTNGKFRWILWDTDFGFDLYYWAPDATHPTLQFATEQNGPGWPNPPWSTEHIRMVLENPIFRNRFIQTFSTALTTAFSPDRVNALITAYASRIQAEVPFHKQRWGGSINDWTFEVNRLRAYANQRPAYMLQHLQSFFGLTQAFPVQSILPQGQGKIELNKVTLTQAQSITNHFQGTTLQVKAIPLPGYSFLNWKITNQTATTLPLITVEDTWRYTDAGTLPAPDWFSNAYNDAAWKTGQAEFGYGEGDEKTIVSFGSDANNKFITTYFRKKINIPSTTGLTDAQATIKADDGAIVYCNGIEVFRYNMPAGVVQNNTLALQNATENIFVNFVIPASVFQVGDNVIAVEIHQVSANSSDISFDLNLQAQILGALNTTTSVNPQLTLPVNSSIKLEAFFQPGTPPLSGIVINEVNAAVNFAVRDNFNEPEDFIEIYNTTNQSISLAGLYITDNLSIKDKHQIQAGNGTEMQIEPGGFKVLWADEDLNQGADHLSFKLSDDGEAVGLYQLINETFISLSEYVFTRQTHTGSFSRIPDGTGDFLVSPTATPKKPNTLTTESNSPFMFAYGPNPVKDFLTIESDQTIRVINLYNINGTKFTVNWDNQTHQLDMTDCPDGLYLLVLETTTARNTIKILKQ